MRFPLALTTGVALAIFLLAVDGGAFGLTTRGSLAIGVWWTIAAVAALGLAPRDAIPRAALVTGGFLAAFVAWTGASIAWADSAERALTEFNRAALYLGIFVLAVIAGRRRLAPSWADGLAIGLTGIGLIALASRLFPDLLPEGEFTRFLGNRETRLSYPVNYSNGLGILIGLAFPLLLRGAIAHERTLWRGLSLAPLPALVATIYLTISRGGAATALVATVAFLALTSRRWAAAGSALLAGAGSAVVAAVIYERDELVNAPFEQIAEDQGQSAALWIALVCIAVGGLHAVGSRLLARVREPAPAIGWAVVIVIALAGIVGVAAADPGERFDSFKAPPTTAETAPERLESRLLSANSTWRWQFWKAAADQFQEEPLAGQGAGSYEAWWAQHRSIPMFVTDAHSLYLETLGELGVVGFVLLACAFGAGLAAGILALIRNDDPERITIASLAACFVAFAFAAGIDWMWELTIVPVVGFACLGLLAASRQSGSRAPRLPVLARVAVVVTALFLIGSQASPLLASLEVGQSQAAVERGDAAAALEHAENARDLEPWAASPYLQLALVAEQTGDVRAARRWIVDAIDRDPLDWALWLTRARIETKSGLVAPARRSLDRAAALNPRSPLFRRP
jgi:tetratricopeptide (TPR) repeat protein